MKLFKMRRVFTESLPVFYFICALFIPSIFCLTCYECQEHRAGDWCQQPSKQKCNSATSICLKYLHKEGKPGFPNHVMAKCELRTYYTQNRINACERSVRKRNGALTITEICTCDTDLCNDASLNVGKMIDEHPEEAHESAPPPPPEDTEEHMDEEHDLEEHSDQAVESPPDEEMNHDDDDLEENASAEEQTGENGVRGTVSDTFSIIAVILAHWVFLARILATP